VLLKDSVIQATGFVMHREMRGEKSIEIRLDDVKLLEESLFPDYPKGANSAGIVTISIWRGD